MKIILVILEGERAAPCALTVLKYEFGPDKACFNRGNSIPKIHTITKSYGIT